MLGLGAGRTIPRTRVDGKLVYCERKAEYRADGERGYSAGSGARSALTAGGEGDDLINIGSGVCRIACTAVVEDGRGGSKGSWILPTARTG